MDTLCTLCLEACYLFVHNARTRVRMRMCFGGHLMQSAIDATLTLARFINEYDKLGVAIRQ